MVVLYFTWRKVTDICTNKKLSGTELLPWICMSDLANIDCIVYNFWKRFVVVDTENGSPHHTTIGSNIFSCVLPDLLGCLVVIVVHVFDKSFKVIKPHYVIELAMWPTCKKAYCKLSYVIIRVIECLQLFHLILTACGSSWSLINPLRTWWVVLPIPIPTWSPSSGKPRLAQCTNFKPKSVAST